MPKRKRYGYGCRGLFHGLPTVASAMTWTVVVVLVFSGCCSCSGLLVVDVVGIVAVRPPTSIRSTTSRNPQQLHCHPQLSSRRGVTTTTTMMKRSAGGSTDVTSATRMRFQTTTTTTAFSFAHRPTTARVPCQQSLVRLSACHNAAEISTAESEFTNSAGGDIAHSSVTSASSLSTTTTTTTTTTRLASKRAMLAFAIPALGIYLTNPLMSNIDNAFVGRFVGTTGLAALSPATIGTDQMLYLFSFLGRATTGIVARAYAATDMEQPQHQSRGNTLAARDSASAPLSVSLICGTFLTLFYTFFTPTMLSTLHVDPVLRPAASSYIYWRGAIAWAALAQNACVSILMATRDAQTPLVIIGVAAAVNVVGDALLCAWPLQWGCAGAAAATAMATLLSCGCMLKALAAKNLLPQIRIPSRKELFGLLEFTGPLLAITIARLGGVIAMQRTAMRLGVQSLAGYQLCINLLMFFVLFGEPLSQLSQTKLPSLLDRGDGPAVYATLQSILTLAGFTAVGVAAVSYAMATFGSGIISSDVAVQLAARTAAPALFMNVAVAIFAIAVDGAMLASRDFGFLLSIGVATLFLQLGLLPYCTSVSDILGTFTVRLATYTIAVLGRLALGHGGVGRVMRSNSRPAIAVP